jgi:hypothetical protein
MLDQTAIIACFGDRLAGGFAVGLTGRGAHTGRSWLEVATNLNALDERDGGKPGAKACGMKVKNDREHDAGPRNAKTAIIEGY